tara:strand:- start:12481 stop:14487 length:2007 start_codon:yes stop_codon:yes gene_type:complete
MEGETYTKEFYRRQYNLIKEKDWKQLLENLKTPRADKSINADEIIYTILSIGEYNRSQLHPTLIKVTDVRTIKPVSNSICLQDEFKFKDFQISHKANYMPQPYDNPNPMVNTNKILQPRLETLNVVLAGGSCLANIRKSLMKYKESGGYTDVDVDADHFIYHSRPCDETVIPIYNAFMNDINNSSIIQKTLIPKGRLVTKIFKSEHLTDIDFKYIPHNDGDIISDPLHSAKNIQIQLIHRAYKSPEQVVVGFDQAPSKVFYDGEDYYMTLDAALCFYFSVNPIDWRCMSPTHISRAIKYTIKGFNSITPKYMGAKQVLEFESPIRYKLVKKRYPGTITYIVSRFGGLECEKKDGYSIWGAGALRILYDDDGNNVEYWLFDKDSQYTQEILKELSMRDYSMNNFSSDYSPAEYTSIILSGDIINDEHNPPGKLIYGLDNIRLALKSIVRNEPTKFYQVDFGGDYNLKNWYKDMLISELGLLEYRHYPLHAVRLNEIHHEITTLKGDVTVDRREDKSWVSKWGISRNNRHKNKVRVSTRPHNMDYGDDAIEKFQRILELSKEAKMLCADVLERFENNFDRIYDRRALQPYFRYDNPGTQITASFNPIHIGSHNNYWGNCFNDIKSRPLAWTQLQSLYILMKRGVIPHLPKDIILIIRSHLVIHSIFHFPE